MLKSPSASGHLFIGLVYMCELCNPQQPSGMNHCQDREQQKYTLPGGDDRKFLVKRCWREF